MRRIGPLTVALSLAAVLATNLVAVPAHAAEPRNSAAAAAPVYEIEFRRSSLCLTVYNGAPMGSQAMQWNCDGYANGRWTFEFVDASWAKIRNQHSGKCLTVYGGSMLGSPVMQWNCDGYANGLWFGQFVEPSDGRGHWYRLINKETRYCLNISALGSSPLGRGTILGSCALETYLNNQVTWYPPR